MLPRAMSKKGPGSKAPAKHPKKEKKESKKVKKEKNKAK